MSAHTSIGKIWIDNHYPNKTLVTEKTFIIYNYPNFVIKYIKDNWYKSINSSGKAYWEKHYTDNTNTFKTYNSNILSGYNSTYLF